MKKRLISLLLTLVLVIQILPISIFAKEAKSAEATPGQRGTVVLSEMPDRRKEMEKHFRMNDGSFIVVDYGVPVHYSTDGGETWNDIDNTLTLSRGDAELYVAENGDIVRSFAPNLVSGLLFSASDGAYSVRMGMIGDTENSGAGARSASSVAEISYPDTKTRGSEELPFAEQITPSKLQADVLYRNVYDGVDLSYTLYSYNVKETILVNERLDSYAFSFTLDTDGLTPVLLDDGSIELLNEGGEAVYQIPAPYMVDASGAESTDVSYSLIQTKNTAWKLIVTADKGWVNAPDRMFPVAIDPTVIDIRSATEFIGRCIASDGNPHQYISRTNGVCGYHPTYGQTEWYFKLEDLPEIPKSCEAIYSSLYIRQNDFAASSYGPLYLSIRPCLSAISNYNVNISWSDKPALGEVLDYVVASSGTIQTWHTWEITKAVKQWYSSPSSNYGLAMTSDATSANKRRAWFSYSKMYLVVAYRDVTGIEPYYTYQSMDVGRAGTAYISDFSGNLTTVTPLVSYASSVNPISLNLVYNSSYFTGEAPEDFNVPVTMGYKMRMGSGMKLDILQKVEYEDLPDESTSTGFQKYMKYTDGDGTSHYFAKDLERDSTGTWYYDEDGLGLKINEFESGNFRLEDDKGNYSIFIHGFLTSVVDTNGNKVQIYFSDSNGTINNSGEPSGDDCKPAYVKQINNNQAAITVATFTYDSDSEKTLQSVTDYAGNSYTFQYGNNKLLSIQRNNIGYAGFIYGDPQNNNSYVNPVIGVTDLVNGYYLDFTYTDNKISEYHEKAIVSDSPIVVEDGAGVSISRIIGERTTYTDWGNDRNFATINDNISTTYLFDYAGRTVNAFSIDATGAVLGASNAVHTGIGTTNKQNNRTLLSAEIGKAAMPLLRNGSFERSDCDWNFVVPASNAAAVVRANEKTRTGNNALKLWIGSTAVGPFEASRPTEQLQANKTYTASVYVNSSEASYRNTSPGVYLTVTDGTHIFTGDDLKYSTNEAIDDGWARISVSFTAPVTNNYTAKICVDGMKGIFYFDDFQIEESTAPSNVNLLQNGGVTYWGDTWLNEANITATFSNYISSQGNGQYDFSLKIAGNPTADNNIHQTVALNEPSAQTYVLSGWAKADAVPDNVTTETGDDKEAKDKNKQFGLRAILTYNDNTTEYFYVPFNPNVSDWQFASLAIVPKATNKTVATIKVICAYEKNANTAYFDNLSLVKEVAQTMQYDSDGHLTLIRATGGKEETRTYSNGNLSQLGKTGYGAFNFLYDDANYSHRLTGLNNGNNSGSIKEEFDYDAVGNITNYHISKNEANPAAAQTINASQAYTNSGNLISSTTDANGSSTTYLYNSDLNKMFGLPKTTTNAKGTVVQTNYLDDGRVSSSWIGSNIGLFITYNSNNKLTQLRRAGYNVTGNDPTPHNQYYNFSYDAFGNTTSISVGDTATYDLGLYSYAAKNGMLTSMTYGNGATVSYTYDDYGRKTQTTTSSGDSYSYTFTGDGQLYEMKDTAGSLLYRYTYDTLGRMIGSTMKFGSEAVLLTKHQYDNADRLSMQMWSLPGSQTYQETYEYDNHGRLATKTIEGVANTPEDITLDYDNLSRLDTVTTPAATYRYTYKAAGNGTGTTELVSTFSATPQQTGGNEFDPYYIGYSYDVLGNITQEQYTLQNAIPLRSISYIYDNQSQLTTAVSSDYGTWSYQYDAYGNIRSKVHGNDAVSYTYGDANWLDLLTAVSGTRNGNSFSGTYTYDGSGNPTSFYNVGDLSAWTMTWKNGRELASATNGTHTVSYDYDVNGLRTYKIIDGVQHDYIYASGQLLRESFIQGGTAYTLDFLYDQNGRPYMLNLTTAVSNQQPVTVAYYYILNLQGDVLYLVDGSGEPVASYTYDPYGTILSASGSLASINPLRYRGYYFDDEIGFYYLQSRYYDPALCRFINADSYVNTAQGFLGYNMFAYCANDPVGRSDPAGEKSVVEKDRRNYGNGCIAYTDSGKSQQAYTAGQNTKDDSASPASQPMYSANDKDSKGTSLSSNSTKETAKNPTSQKESGIVNIAGELARMIAKFWHKLKEDAEETIDATAHAVGGIISYAGNAGALGGLCVWIRTPYSTWYELNR